MLQALAQAGSPPNPFDQMDAVQILVLLAMFLLLIVIFVFSIVVICFNGPAIKRSWRVGTAVAVVLLIIMSASVVSTLFVMDIEKQVMAQGGGAAHLSLPVVYTVMAIFILGVLLVKSAWYVLVFAAGVGEWGRAGLPGYVLLMRRDPRAWPGIWLGVVLGTVSAVISVAVMVWLGTGVGPLLDESMFMFQGVEDLAWPMSILIFSLAVLGPAITEELTFRGLMLGFFFRISKHNRIAMALSIVVVSILWSLLHVPNTDMPFVKCTQIFLIGLIFGELARRRGIEAAIAGHVALNLVAVGLSVLWM